MKSDDIAAPYISEIKTFSPSSSLRDQVIYTTSEDPGSNSSNSSGSSPSDLKRRLRDLPSSDEFTLLSDRVAALNRRICRKREFFFKLHGLVDRIEESDECEGTDDREKLKDARARRRARTRLKASPRHDEEMVISRVDCIGPSETTDDDDKFNPAESSADRSVTRDCNYSQLVAIEIPRRQPRPTSLSEPPTTRFHCDNDGEQCDVKDAPFHTYRDLKWSEMQSVSPFRFSNVRPKKFGGYRPSTGVVVKNLSSGSESESLNEYQDFPSASGIDNPIATLELSPSESKVATINGLAKKIPFMSANNDITRPNLSSSSPRDDNSQLWQDSSSNFLDGARISRDKSATQIRDELEVRSSFVPASVACNEQISHKLHDGLFTKMFEGSPQTGNKLWQVETEYEGSRDEKEGKSVNTLTLSAESFMSTELLTSVHNGHTTYNNPVTKIRNEQVESDTDKGCNETERTMSLSRRSQEAVNFHENSDDNFSRNISDDVYLPRMTSAYTRETVDSPHFTEGAPNDITEEILSSTSEPFVSGGRSSCTPNIYSQRGAAFSNRSHWDDIDAPNKRDCEITTITNVPTLALNSQDISYSTSTGSRECSAMRPLDPHVLIKALSNVSLRQAEKGKNGASREREEDPRRQGKDAIDVASEASDLPAKGETWRVSRVLTSHSPGKPPSRVPSRIPVRISSNKTVFSDGANEYSEYRVKEKKNKDYEEQFVDCNDTSNNQYFLKIKDNAKQSRFGRLVVSENSENIARVTESSWQSGIRNDERNRSTRVESSKNRKASGTQEMENEHVSTGKDKENPEERIKSMFKKMHDSLSSKAQTFQSDSPSYIEKIVKSPRIEVDLEFHNMSSFDQDVELPKVAQSESLMLQLRRTQEYSNFAARMSSSTLNLSKEPKRKRKSQERCPFTISEAPGILSTKHEDTTDCQAFDEGLHLKNTKEYDQMEERETVVHHLKMHPSITRLATAGLEDNATETSRYVEHDRKDDEPPSKSRMKQIVLWIFPSKRKKMSKQQKGDILESTKIIYKNRACQEDSAANSSESSLTEEVNRLNFDKSSNSHWASCHVAKSNPKFICDENVMQKTERSVKISQEYPCRRYDRDDLWVQDFKRTSFEGEKDGETLRKKDRADSQKNLPSEDQYSIFFVKNLQPDKILKSNVDCDDSLKIQKRDILFDHETLSAGKSKKGMDKDFVSEIEEIEEVLTGCFCLRLCRLIAPPKHRLSIREKVPLERKKSSSLLWKRKE